MGKSSILIELINRPPGEEFYVANSFAYFLKMAVSISQPGKNITLKIILPLVVQNFRENDVSHF